MKKKHWVLLLLALAAVAGTTPSYLKAYRVAGSSDAPSFLVGDRILMMQAAYDLRLPYTDIVIYSHSEPSPGDVVMFQNPGDEALVFKRVVGRPGDTVAMRDNRLEINGVPLRYQPVDSRPFQPVARENRLGAIIEMESGLGDPHLVTHSGEDGPHASFAAVRVPEGHYYVIGDNRDNSLDSRMYGAIARHAILGRVSWRYSPDP